MQELGDFFMLMEQTKKTIPTPEKSAVGIPPWYIHEITSQGTNSRGKPHFDAVAHRQEIYKLQDKATKALSDQHSIVETKVTKYQHRVNYCKRCRIDKETGVLVFVNNETKKAQYGNLVTCGDIWTCPVCANKVTTVRAMEIAHAVAQAPAFAFMTLTVPHGFSDALETTLDYISRASETMFRHRQGRRAITALSAHGRVTTSEVKWGRVNGWHPHLHLLFFLDRPLAPQYFHRTPLAVNGAWVACPSRKNQHGIKYKSFAHQKFYAKSDVMYREIFTKLWIDACTTTEMPKLPSTEHGVDFRAITDKQAMEHIASYMSKFGCMPAPNENTDGMGRINNEMTKWHSKNGGSSQSLTPFDLLRLSNPNNPNCMYTKLFREFAKAYQGKKQLFWTNYLKSMYGVNEMSDDEIAHETEKNATVFHEISQGLWAVVVWTGNRAKVLELAEQDHANSTDNLHIFLIELSMSWIEQNPSSRYIDRIYRELQRLDESLYQAA